MGADGAEFAISLLGHNGSSRFRNCERAVWETPGVGVGVGAGEDFLLIFSSGAVRDLVLLAAIARAGTVLSGGRQMGLILGFSLSLISALIWLSSSSKVLVFSSSNSMRIGDSRPEGQPGLSIMSLKKKGTLIGDFTIPMSNNPTSWPLRLPCPDSGGSSARFWCSDLFGNPWQHEAPRSTCG